VCSVTIEARTLASGPVAFALEVLGGATACGKYYAPLHRPWPGFNHRSRLNLLVSLLGDNQRAHVVTGQFVVLHVCCVAEREGARFPAAAENSLFTFNLADLGHGRHLWALQINHVVYTIRKSSGLHNSFDGRVHTNICNRRLRQCPRPQRKGSGAGSKHTGREVSVGLTTWSPGSPSSLSKSPTGPPAVPRSTASCTAWRDRARHPRRTVCRSARA